MIDSDMKKITNLLYMLAVLLLASCSDFLDKSPKNTVDPETTVTGILNRLEEKGYIARRRNPDDGRYRIIEVTEKGNQVMEDMGEGARNLDERIYACMTDEEQAKLLELLDRILATMTENDGTEEQLEQHRERITQGGHTC